MYTHTHTHTGGYRPHGAPGPAGAARRDFDCAQVHAHWGDGGMIHLERERERERDLKIDVCVCVCVCV